MIIITGPGRSGTSVLAQFCLQMGYHPGGSWYDCVDAGLEHPRVAAINDALYHEATKTGKVEQTLAQYREEMRSLDLAVVKDPRFTFHPAILRAWRSVRTDLKVLMTYRTPEHSLASRKRHARNLLHKDKAHPDILRRDFANVIETMLDQEIAFAMLLFPNFLNQYQKVYEAFRALGMEFDYAEGQAAWNSLVNMEKVHFRPAVSQQAASVPPAVEKRWQRVRIGAMPLAPDQLSPGLALSLLVVLVCAPFSWRNVSAAAAQWGQGEQSTRPARQRVPYAMFARPTNPFQFQGPRVRLGTAFMAGLALYSVHRFPLNPWYVGMSFPSGGIRQLRHPSG